MLCLSSVLNDNWSSMWARPRWWCLRNVVVQRKSSHTEGQPLSGFNHSNTWAWSYIIQRGMVVAIDKLTVAGKKALFALCRKCNELSITDPEVMCQLFDSLVCPVLSYACEVWTGCTGVKRLQQAEQVHRMFLRGILGVNKTTSTFAVLGEFGRYSLEYFWWQQTFKYYDKLWESTPDRLLYCAYQT